MPTPEEFYGPWEPDPVSSVSGFLELIEQTFSRWSGREVAYVWRGVLNAEWPVHSALYRRLRWTHPSRVEERHLLHEETRVIDAAHRWGLDYVDRSRLTSLYQLAMLQHFGAPTRLLDVTFNPLVALYFAVEDRRDDDAEPIHADKDGRLFVFDISTRLIEGGGGKPPWDGLAERPWVASAPIEGWTTQVWGWRPSPIEARFAAQNGGFLIGGVPQTGGGVWRKGPDTNERWPIADVRDYTSVAVRFHRLQPGAGRPPNHPGFTLRVPAAAKAEIRRQLRDWFDIDSRTIYPDHPGFADLGLPDLRRRP